MKKLILILSVVAILTSLASCSKQETIFSPNVFDGVYHGEYTDNTTGEKLHSLNGHKRGLIVEGGYITRIGQQHLLKPIELIIEENNGEIFGYPTGSKSLSYHIFNNGEKSGDIKVVVQWDKVFKVGRAVEFTFEVYDENIGQNWNNRYSWTCKFNLSKFEF